MTVLDRTSADPAETRRATAARLVEAIIASADDELAGEIAAAAMAAALHRTGPSISTCAASSAQTAPRLLYAGAWRPREERVDPVT